MREISRLTVFINNLPYMSMLLTGAAIFVLSLGMTAWAWTAAVAYVIYGLIGAFWIMYFLCPFCGYHGTRGCPCGYGWLSSLLRAKQDPTCFSKKFKWHIPVIVPLWFLPLIPGIWACTHTFSWLLVSLMVVFAVISFVIIPLTSTRHGCTECAQRDNCPWMKKKPGTCNDGVNGKH